MAKRVFGYMYQEDKYVINPTEAEAVRDYFSNYDFYSSNPSAFEEKWKDVIEGFLKEVEESKFDTKAALKDNLSLLNSATVSTKPIIDEKLWENARKVIDICRKKI